MYSMCCINDLNFCLDEPQEVEYEEEGFEDDDDVLSISSDDDEITQTS